jgi:hypothetical protein
LRTLMKFYFWPYLAVEVIGTWMTFCRRFPVGETLLSSALDALCLVCVFLYAFDKKWLSPVFWQACFILVVADILYHLLFPGMVMEIPSRFLYFGVFFFGLVLSLPALIAMYLYAFKADSSQR